MDSVGTRIVGFVGRRHGRVVFAQRSICFNPKAVIIGCVIALGHVRGPNIGNIPDCIRDLRINRHPCALFHLKVVFRVNPYAELRRACRSHRSGNHQVIAGSVSDAAGTVSCFSVPIEAIGDRITAVGLVHCPGFGLRGNIVLNEKVGIQIAGVVVHGTSQRDLARTCGGTLELYVNGGNIELISRLRRDGEFHVILAGHGIGNGFQSPLSGIETLFIARCRQPGSSGNGGSGQVCVVELGTCGFFAPRQPTELKRENLS